MSGGTKGSQARRRPPARPGPRQGDRAAAALGLGSACPEKDDEGADEHHEPCRQLHRQRKSQRQARLRKIRPVLRVPPAGHRADRKCHVQGEREVHIPTSRHLEDRGHARHHRGGEPRPVAAEPALSGPAEHGSEEQWEERKHDGAERDLAGAGAHDPAKEHGPHTVHLGPEREVAGDVVRDIDEAAGRRRTPWVGPGDTGARPWLSAGRPRPRTPMPPGARPWSPPRAPAPIVPPGPRSRRERGGSSSVSAPPPTPRGRALRRGPQAPHATDRGRPGRARTRAATRFPLPRRMPPRARAGWRAAERRGIRYRRPTGPIRGARRRGRTTRQPPAPPPGPPPCRGRRSEYSGRRSGSCSR